MKAVETSKTKSLSRKKTVAAVLIDVAGGEEEEEEKTKSDQVEEKAPPKKPKRKLVNETPVVTPKRTRASTRSQTGGDQLKYDFEQEVLDFTNVLLLFHKCLHELLNVFSSKGCQKA